MVASIAANLEIHVFAVKGEDSETYYQHINAALDHVPHITMDDGADPVSTLHRERADLSHNVIGGTAETATVSDPLHQVPLRQPLRHRPTND